jgi:hypothetical protein
MEKSGLFAFRTSWWEPYLKTDSKSIVDYISMLPTGQNKYNAQVKDEIIGMLMIEGCDSEGLKNHLKNEYKINGKIDCYHTTSSKAADLIDSYIEVGGNNYNKNHKTTGNDNEDEQIAGIHATDQSNDSLNNDTSIPKEQPDELMNAALAAVQDGGEEDPNYYSPLKIDDIDFDSEQVAGIHVVDEDVESVEDSSSNSSSYHLSDHYYCSSDDDMYSTSSDDDDESSIDSDMPGLQPRGAEFSSSDDEETIASDTSVDHNDDDDSIQGSIISNSTDDFPSIGFVPDAFNSQTVIPSPTTTPLYMVPPVSCVVIPNDIDDVNSSTTAPVNERVDPTGRIPVRIQQDYIAHVDDVICHKPTLLDIGGKPVQNWAHFLDTRLSFPTQVSNNRIRVICDLVHIFY